MKELLAKLTAQVDSKPVECDGASRLVHLALLRADIPHRCMSGIVTYSLSQCIPLHHWIEVDDAGATWVIDYRLRPWLDGENLPTGVFSPDDHPNLIYSGFEMEYSVKSCVVVEMTT